MSRFVEYSWHHRITFASRGDVCALQQWLLNLPTPTAFLAWVLCLIWQPPVSATARICSVRAFQKLHGPWVQLAQLFSPAFRRDAYVSMELRLLYRLGPLWLNSHRVSAVELEKAPQHSHPSSQHCPRATPAKTCSIRRTYCSRHVSEKQCFFRVLNVSNRWVAEYSLVRRRAKVIIGRRPRMLGAFFQTCDAPF